MVDKKLLIKIVLVLLSITLVGIVVGIIVSNSGGDNNKLKTIERVANNRYYSYAKTVLEGGVIPSLSCVDCYYGGPLNGQAFTTVGNPSMDNGSPLYQIDYGPWKGQTFVDFDSSSGLMCGNSWGQPSKQAEIIYNILSLSAPNPIIQNKQVHKKFVQDLYYTGNQPPIWNTDWQTWHTLQPPKCYKSKQYFMNGSVYVGGFMGLSYNFASEYICWGHYGETYGYTSLSQFFPGTISQKFNGLLKGIDVAFVVAQNTDTQEQGALSDALSSLLTQLSDKQYSINTEKDLQNAIGWAINYAYTTGKQCGSSNDPIPCTNLNGLMMTIGYYYIKNSTSYRGSKTMAVVNNKLVEPTKEFPFKDQFLGADREPAYYYGSGTKPITTSLVTNAICNSWFKNNKQGTAYQFLKWYRGSGLDSSDDTYKTFGAATMRDILKLGDQSYYLETIEKYTKSIDPKNIGNPAFTLSSETIQNWYKIIFSNDNTISCSWKGLSQDPQRCPTNQCYEILNAQGNPEADPLKNPPHCDCQTLTKLSDIFSLKLSPIDMLNMNGGIPDADTVLTGTKGLIPSPNALQLDYIDQLIGRTQSIGSMNFIRELIGFNWIPGWNNDSNGNIKPNTIGVDGYNLPGEYSSSGFTTLGTILWVLDPLGPKSENHAKNWTDIKINESFLSSPLQKNNNYAGTSGNGGEKYFVEKNSLPQHNVLPKCNISNSKRMDRDCIGPSGADKTTCLMEDCCYQPSFMIKNGDNVPWCFKKNE